MCKLLFIVLFLLGCPTNEHGVDRPPKKSVETDSKSEPSESISNREVPRYFVYGDLPLPTERIVYIKEKGGAAIDVAVFRIDKSGMIEIVSTTGEYDERVKRSVRRSNQRKGFSVQIPPPSGKRGKYGKLFERNDPFIGAALRDVFNRNHGLLFRD